MEMNVDVVIVGAGFAGLAAASCLKSQGISSVVLEARDRIGKLDGPVVYMCEMHSGNLVQLKSSTR